MTAGTPQRPPIPQAPLVDNRGYVTREWWRWFHTVGLVEEGNTTNVISTIISQAGDTNFSGGLNDPAGLSEGARKTLELQVPADRVFPDQIVLQARQLARPQDPVGPEQAASLGLELHRPIDLAALDQASQSALQLTTPADALPLDQLALMAAMLVPPAPPSTAAAASTSTPTADWDDPFIGAWSAGGWGTGAWGGLYYGIIPPSTAGQVWVSRGDAITPEWSFLPGTTTNDNADAGNVGEYVSAGTAAVVSISTGVSADITSITLTAGDWDVWGDIGIIPLGTPTRVKGWIGTTSATAPVFPATGALFNLSLSYTAAASVTFPVGVTRLSLAATTTVYLSVVSDFSSTATAGGFIAARRAR